MNTQSSSASATLQECIEACAIHHDATAKLLPDVSEGLAIARSKLIDLQQALAEQSDYWLLRSLAEYVGRFYGFNCQRRIEGHPACNQTSFCITEWCEPCAAKAWLQTEQDKEKLATV